MATQKQMDATYNYMDEICRLSLGENADITCALFDGDYSKTLEEAQKAKHDYVLNSIRFRDGERLLDVGCGWGPILKAAKDRGGHGVGVTLSEKQAESCRRSGLESYVKDWKDISRDTFDPFDGVVSIGAFEHFCSEEEYLAGQQEDIYDKFFRLCRELLPATGRLFLQTMTWGRNAPPHKDISLNAKKGSNEHIVAVLEKFYPGSWLPAGEEQVVKAAKPYFKVIDVKDGRKDYIETTKRFDAIWKLDARKIIPTLKLLPYFVRDKDFRYKLQSLWHGYNGECFKREVMDHRRIVFEKI